MESFSISIRIQEDDILALRKFHLSRKKFMWIRIAALFIIMYYFIDLNIANKFLTIFLAAISTTAVVLILNYISKQRHLKGFKSNKTYMNDIHYTFYRDHYEINTEKSSGSFTWLSRNALLWDDSYFYIYHSNELASVIPKRYLDIEQVTFLEGIIIK